MPRRPIAVAVLAVAAALAAGSAAAADRYVAPNGSGALFVFTGHGWGHGVGLSQYGANGYAQHGWTAPQILDHYYPGTTIGKAPVSQIRVLLADKKKSFKLGSDVPFAVRDGAGRTHRVDGGDAVIKAAPDGTVLVGTQKLTPPLLFSGSPGSPLSLVRAYRGRIQVDVVDGKLRAIDIVPLEQYLWGVVPSEMPSAWSPEALKAQAVAARSYALATRQVGAPFDVYSDTRSQMYLGVDHESSAASAAVNATKGQVLLYAGKVAYTYFFSTSGGRTESNANWGGSAVPYLVSVTDPYDTLSPYHNWGPTPVTGKAVVAALKVKGPLSDMRITRNSSGRAGAVDVIGPAVTTVLGTKLRGALGLRSTWFDVGVLSLLPPAPNVPVPYGSTVQLRGAIRGVTGVSLEQRTTGSTWQTTQVVTPAADGSVVLSVAPTATTDYRLGTPALAAAFARIRVSPLVAITSATVSAISGTVLPLLPDSPIAVQTQNPDLTWSEVATGTVAVDGTFSLPVQIAAGAVYRLVVTPGQGFAPATTPAQTMVG
jgi:stage II sporulation protein D